MGLEPVFDIDNLFKRIDKQVEVIEKVIIEQFELAGEDFIANARNNGEYTDRTGNLRSSIGYIIFKDGKPLRENFIESEKGTDRATGRQKGYNVAMDAEGIPQIGYCLVVVAGMNYGIYVEAKGFDVLTGSSLEAGKDIRERMKLIKSTI